MISCYEDRPWRILQQKCQGGKEIIKGLPTETETTFQFKPIKYKRIQIHQATKANNFTTCIIKNISPKNNFWM